MPSDTTDWRLSSVPVCVPSERGQTLAVAATAWRDCCCARRSVATGMAVGQRRSAAPMADCLSVRNRRSSSPWRHRSHLPGTRRSTVLCVNDQDVTVLVLLTILAQFGAARYSSRRRPGAARTRIGQEQEQALASSYGLVVASITTLAAIFVCDALAVDYLLLARAGTTPRTPSTHALSARIAPQWRDEASAFAFGRHQEADRRGTSMSRSAEVRNEHRDQCPVATVPRLQPVVLLGVDADRQMARRRQQAPRTPRAHVASAASSSTDKA